LFDFSNLVFDPTLNFSIIFSTQNNVDYGWVEYSLNGGSSWFKLGNYWSGGINWYNNTSGYWTGTSDSNTPGNWITASHELTGMAGYSNVKIRMVFYANSGSTDEGFGVDYVSIQKVTPYDVGIISIDGPESGRENTSSELSSKQQITVTIENFGSETRENIQVKIQINSSTISSTIPGPVDPGTTYQHTLSTTTDMSTPGSYWINAWTTLPFDTIPDNDSTLNYFIQQVANDPLTLPFVEDFEDAWSVSYQEEFIGLYGIEECDYYNTDSDGRLRTDAGFGVGGSQAITLDVATSGTYQENYLMMTLNLENYVGKDVIMTFAYMHHNDEEDYQDRVWIRGSDQDQFISIYYLHDDIKDPGEYKYAKNIDISKALSDSGQQFSSSTQVLFVQYDNNPANTSTNTDGFTFDNIGIYERPDNDVAVVDIIGPESGCAMSDQEKVTVKVYNYGNKTQNNFPIYYLLNNGSVTKGTFNKSIKTGDTLEYTFTTSFDASAEGSYVVDAWTGLSTDEITMNDSIQNYNFDHLSVSVNSFPADEDYESFSTGSPGVLANGWSNDDVNDDHDWYVNSGSTGSTGTGPSGDHTTGFGKYMYVEASVPYNPDVKASLLSPCADIFDLSKPILRFWYHMYGAAMGKLHVDIKFDGEWDNDIVVISGDNGDQWIEQEISLTSYKGVLQIRFRAVTGSGFTSDIAIDDVIIYDSKFDLVKEKTNASCGGTDGVASVTANGGIPGYTYQWSSGETTQGVTNLAPGTYNVTVWDSESRETIESLTILEESQDTLNFLSVSNLDCFGDSDGKITAEVLGSQSPYIYNWSNGLTTLNASNLGAGNFTLTVTDKNGCVLVGSKSISAPDEIVLNESFAVSDSVNATGSATVDPVGGIPPYSYSWSDGQIGATATGLSPGSYTIIVTDANGCQETGIVTVYTVGLTDLIVDGIKVYPNPSSGKVSVEIPEINKNTTLKVINLLGGIVYSETNILSNRLEIDLSGLPTGSYMVLLKSNTAVFSRKILLVR